jgi:hypothetical protein
MQQKHFHSFRMDLALLKKAFAPARRRRFNLSGPMRPLHDHCENAFCRHAHTSLKQQLQPVVRIMTMRPAPFSGDALPMETIAARKLP